MTSSVLVPLDGSEEAKQAIPYAQRLLSDGGTLLLFTAVPTLKQLVTNEPALTELQWALQPAQDAARLMDVDAVQASLKQIAERASDARLKWTVQVSEGDPTAEMLRTIERQGVDLVAMSTHGRGSIGRVVFGSVADRVARTSPVPVLLIRPDLTAAVPDAVEIRRLLVPLDGSDLAEEALPLAAELAQRLAIPIHLLRAIDAASVLASLSGGSFFPVTPPQGVYDQLIKDLDDSARAYLTGVATRLQAQGVDVSWDVLDGSPYFEIANAIQPDDLVVITSHGRGGIMRWLLGSVAEKLVREAPAPILLVPAADRGRREHGSGD